MLSKTCKTNKLKALIYQGLFYACTQKHQCKILLEEQEIEPARQLTWYNFVISRSAQFNQLGANRGIQSVYLLGKDSLARREDAIKHLQDENHLLQIICSVDIFGEGIDIPTVSHVLFLRPTQSFTVFLQQLGRGLRQLPDKDYLVALDFVGNFKHAYVANLVI